ncbi:hypothetical protein [Nocardia sp. NPDC005998]|uniref:hypothetical protein n=1 Tax=Nocardia sp. NPDC005998 TaxID=3156894 RepID=UPI0033A637F8
MSTSKAADQVSTRVALPIVAAVVCMNVGFIGLGAVFDYPRVLSRPSAEVLSLFRAHEAAVVSWFSVLVFGAVLFVPTAVLAGRLDDSPRMRWAVRAGAAAGVVQAIGLLRWPLLVPSLAERAARAGESSSATAEFELWNRMLGSALGKTCGYALTAAWTVYREAQRRERGAGMSLSSSPPGGSSNGWHLISHRSHAQPSADAEGIWQV